MAEVSSVLMLEFNELAPRVVEQLIEAGHLPNFRRLRAESMVMVTDPEEPQDALEPWIQWVTVHTGVGADEHGIQKLGEASKLMIPTLGEVVGAEGGRVWICGSMNLPARAAGGGTYLPDPWNVHARPVPESLGGFVDFVRANVQEHTNDESSQSLRDVARFAWFVTRHGLSARTMRDTLRQLMDERRGRRGSWARASLLDRFQWDLFRWQWRRQPPVFGTFFSNSTAHYQHVYWRNFEPEAFRNQPSDEEQRHFGDAVRYGHAQMDTMVGEALDLADATGATLMLCTALSQQPYVRAEETGGKYIHRPFRLDHLFEVLGLEQVVDSSPVMAEQFHVYFSDEAAAHEAAEVLRGATVGERPAFSVRVVGDDVLAGCAVFEKVPADVELVVPGRLPVRFSELFCRSDSAKSGFHHPDGMWWIRTGTHHRLDDRVSLRSVAPTIVTALGFEPPSTMRAPALSFAVE